MKILLITQYFYPIKGAAAKRTGKLADFLSQNGHDATVLTGFPSYPTGKLDKKYWFKLWSHEIINNNRVIRVFELPASTNSNIVKRSLNMLSFVSSACIFALFHHRYDAVIVSSPSLLSGLAGLWSSGKDGRFFFDVRDLWPDSAIDMGLIKKQSFLAKKLTRLEKTFYERAEKVLVATPGIKDHLINEKIPESKLELLLNSVDTKKFSPQQNLKTNYGFGSEDFICGYVGNFSRLYDLETIIKTAESLQSEKKIKFWLIGEGEYKIKLQKMAKEKKLTNVVFHQEVELKTLPAMINSFDLGLVPIANISVAKESFPSKTAEYLACAKPVIASISGDLEKYLTQSNAGLIYNSGDAQSLAEAILKLYRDTKLKQQMGQNARELALKIFADSTAQQKINQLFN